MAIDIDHHVIALAIRWLHIVAMATMLGGAALVSWLTTNTASGALVGVAVRYEQLFWLGIGVVVMTGVGNLGSFGLSLPPPITTWGDRFVLKITLVALLVAFSLPRSLVVARIASGAHASTVMLRWLYGATAGGIAAIAGLAVWLAHG